MEVAATIAQLSAPASMASASGLLCLALYNRMTILASRVRDYLAEFEEPAAAIRPENIDRLLPRLRWLRRGVMCLSLGLLGLLATTLLMGVSLVAPALAALAPVVFLVAVLLQMAGVVCAVCEQATCLRGIEQDAELFRKHP